MVAPVIGIGLLSAMGGCCVGRHFGKMQWSNFSVRLGRSTFSYGVSGDGLTKELKLTWPDNVQFGI